MCVGERRRLIIPPSLGMEEMTLSYDVQLTSVGEGKPPVNMWKEIDVNNDHQIDEAEMDRWYLADPLLITTAFSLFLYPLISYHTSLFKPDQIFPPDEAVQGLDDHHNNITFILPLSTYITNNITLDISSRRSSSRLFLRGPLPAR